MLLQQAQMQRFRGYRNFGRLIATFLLFTKASETRRLRPP
jgi:hypothetical protein